ncbi:uncharacterized protein Z520_01668 [Fonsecaea multimorphosa CBS 102226]|uniref:Cyclase n=1 Tax=Fonsecaea multimorphosa CBS 102226 TaxID=1442371 RepID=A0A0D2HMX2_9EURO|nr:uncharacterized protein Z520_01668 [Fonsecaea multimorphosa CBS 102226]KIY03201.1 hypothetical protein Z520_01668 [Fonsecaea multimorphosa CBS 102226]OAL30442.1 hypothetical protein AYO22_01640 [Fonsecaea multimorphosa]
MAQDSHSAFDTPFDQLPNPKRVWVGEPGSREEGLGKLALLTPEVVAQAAASEIKTGKRVGLDWNLKQMEVSSRSRHTCQHHILTTLAGAANDDIYIFNPQQSSQWDGFRHFSQPLDINEAGSDPIVSHSTPRVFYGGTSLNEIRDRSNTRIGTNHWAQEGISGRGVLIDYASWAEKNDITFSAFEQHHISLDTIHRIATQCRIEFRRGDILFVRTGLTREYENMTLAEKNALNARKPLHAGVEATTDVLRFLWDMKFAAVAGDNLSWESYPSKTPGIFMHEWLLPGWGMPIGELFDLERLSRMCKELDRYTFFVTSMPLNMPGGVSSPPNAMAIF